MQNIPSIQHSKQPTTQMAVSVKSAAALLDISEQSVRRLIRRGLLKPSRALRVLRIPVKEIERLINS